MKRRRFILGTAGHVDHGKTELVKSLTGWDTDRLKEEKERGISIELGFAPLPLADDVMIGVIDVPGHERFVKNMVAGAGGVDMAILVVAADEGVMPQTREHLEVLRSLAIGYGAIVVTKTDLAPDSETLALVRAEVADLVKGSFLENAPVVEVSARTGAGLERLKEILKEISAVMPERDASGPFRLAVDRVFQKQGIGVVVTGSCYSGSVGVGDELEVLPSGKVVRVREIQSFGEKRERGLAGERLAIALQGKKLTELERGEMLVTPSKFSTSRMIDARLYVAAYGKFELKQRERIRLHHGAREVLGRVLLLESEKLSSGDRALVQIRLETPIVAGEGDHFVVRKYSPPRVLGGGRVIVPSARRHRRFDSGTLDELRLRESGDPRRLAVAAVRAAGLSGRRAADFDPVLAAQLEREGALRNVDGLLFAREALDALAKDVASLARRYAEANPLRFGIDKEELRQKVKFPHGPALFHRVLEEVASAHALSLKENRVRAGERELRITPELSRDLDALERAIEQAGARFPRLEDLKPLWRASVPLMDALRFLSERDRVVRVEEDGYLHRRCLERCLERLEEWFRTRESLSVTEFKDLMGVTRKHAIPLLELLDRGRFTVRRGDSRARGPRLAASDES